MAHNPNQQNCAVSVIVPVYNREDIIDRAIESLLNQDFDQPYEILVLDDGPQKLIKFPRKIKFPPPEEVCGSEARRRPSFYKELANASRDGKSGSRVK